MLPEYAGALRMWVPEDRSFLEEKADSGFQSGIGESILKASPQ
jgi:hypothetical protein